jgi:hypothetical protein
VTIMSTWHHRDGSKSLYENPPAVRALWMTPDGSYVWAERSYRFVSTASLLTVAGRVYGEAELILRGWRRVLGAPASTTGSDR